MLRGREAVDETHAVLCMRMMIFRRVISQQAWFISFQAQVPPPRPQMMRRLSKRAKVPPEISTANNIFQPPFVSAARRLGDGRFLMRHDDGAAQGFT